MYKVTFILRDKCGIWEKDENHEVSFIPRIGEKVMLDNTYIVEDIRHYIYGGFIDIELKKI